jgi:hypothetical protein
MARSVEEIFNMKPNQGTSVSSTQKPKTLQEIFSPQKQNTLTNGNKNLQTLQQIDAKINPISQQNIKTERQKAEEAMKANNTLANRMAYAKAVNSEVDQSMSKSKATNTLAEGSIAKSMQDQTLKDSVNAKTSFQKFLARERASRNEILTGTTMQKPDSKLSLLADLLGTVEGFAAGGKGSPASAGSMLYKGAETAAEKTLPLAANLIGKASPKAANLLLNPLAKTAITQGAAGAGYETVNSLANNEKMSGKDIALAAGTNALLPVLGKGIGKTVGNLSKNKLPENTFIPDVQNAYKNARVEELPKPDLKPKSFKLGNPLKVDELRPKYASANVKNTTFTPKDLAKYADAKIETPVTNIEFRKNDLLRKETPSISTGESNLTPNIMDLKIERPESETVTMYGEAAKAKQPGKPIPEPVIAEGFKERGFGRNVRTDANMKDEIRDSVTKDPLVYEQLGNKKTLESAQKRFNEGYEVALEKWNNSLSSDSFRADDIPLARMLANEAVNRGEIAGSRKIIADVSEKLTQAGQFSQAARILRNAEDPGAFRVFVDRQLNKLNQQGKQQYGGKWPDIQLTDDEIKIINNWNKSDSAGREQIMEDIYTRIQDQIPVSNLEKFDTWRRIAMLLNPKTHIRNTVGNAIMSVTRKTADTMAASLERVARLPEGQRTKSIGWSKDKNLVNTVNKEWESNKTDLMKSGRWDLENLKFGMLNRDKRIFNNNALDFLDNLSKDTLNFEDAVFMKRAYTDALGQYMSANKMTAVTDAAKNYARRRAWEATFRQANWLSDTIQGLKRKGGIIGKATDIAIPFSKTPANIMQRAVEYSPAGLIKALYSKAKGKSANDVIEDLAKGMVGTGIASLGFLLASMGWARGEKESSKNAEAILSQLGEQAYSISTPLGSYTYDWAQPISVPFAMGVAVYESLEKSARKSEGEEGLDGFTRALNAAQSAVTTGAETIFNLTMMQNIQDLLGGGYGSVSESLLSLPSDYISQAFPTLFGQGARTADDTKRSTYDPNQLKQMANTFIAKTPVASKTLQPNLDVFGREQSQSGGLPRGIQQFLNPGYSKKKQAIR